MNGAGDTRVGTEQLLIDDMKTEGEGVCEAKSEDRKAASSMLRS